MQMASIAFFPNIVGIENSDGEKMFAMYAYAD